MLSGAKSGNFVQKALHDRNIKPFIEFSADLAFNSNQLESKGFMEGDRSLGKSGNSGHYGMKSAISGRFQ
jgi:hypothetical protein